LAPNRDVWTRPFLINIPPNYNVAPTQTAIVIRADAEKKEREVTVMK
jgi:putative SOS response-associated peptidase YedK